MRTIGSLDTQNSAETFALALKAHEIENEISPEENGTYSIWILEDEKMQEATELLKRFNADPDAPEFSEAVRRGSKRLAEEKKKTKKRNTSVVTMERLQYEKTLGKVPRVSVFLVVVSGIVALLSHLGKNQHFLNLLYIQSVDLQNPLTMSALTDVMHGQVWRLVTPIFIHFGILHLAFDCYWTLILGREIERRLGSWHLGSLVFVVAVISNLGQFWWAHSPLFGGLSGVAYGLFGFLWMKSKFDSSNDWFMPPATVTIMLLWLVLCMTGVIGAIANAAHLIGLIIGVVWGFASARLRR